MWERLGANFLKVATGRGTDRQGEKKIQGQRKVKEFYFESGKIDILKKCLRKLKNLTRPI